MLIKTIRTVCPEEQSVLSLCNGVLRAKLQQLLLACSPVEVYWRFGAWLTLRLRKGVGIISQSLLWETQSSLVQSWRGRFRSVSAALRFEQPPAHAGSSLADFSTLKMEAIPSSETSVHTRSTLRHMPEDGILHSHRRETHKSYCVPLWGGYSSVHSTTRDATNQENQPLYTLPFLLRCRDHSTIPCFLQFQLRLNSDAANVIYRRTSFCLLDERIHHTRRELDDLQPPAHTGTSLADFSTLKMESLPSSETSVHTRSIRRHIPENCILLLCSCVRFAEEISRFQIIRQLSNGGFS
jgi:hypothetical protein